MEITDNFRKHTAKNPLQKFLIGRFFDTLLLEAKKVKPESVLDVGCGEGFTLERLRKNKVGSDLVGVDFLDRAIEIGPLFAASALFVTRPTIRAKMS